MQIDGGNRSILKLFFSIPIMSLCGTVSAVSQK